MSDESKVPTITSGRYAAQPKRCVCRGWGEAHPADHHRLCRWRFDGVAVEGLTPEEAFEAYGPPDLSRRPPSSEPPQVTA